MHTRRVRLVFAGPCVRADTMVLTAHALVTWLCIGSRCGSGPHGNSDWLTHSLTQTRELATGYGYYEYGGNHGVSCDASSSRQRAALSRAQYDARVTDVRDRYPDAYTDTSSTLVERGA